MKGIILAGGAGTRLYPATLTLSKQLLPVYDKPMIYYPLTTLMLAGVREVLIISTLRDLPHFKALLGNGSAWGLTLSYAQQAEPKGLAQALLIGEYFLAGEPCMLILGDNLFFGHGLPQQLKQAKTAVESGEAGAAVFTYWVGDPHRYGVLNFDEAGTPIEIEEKPHSPKSNWAVTGLYVYNGQASALAKTLAPSPRGELEITDLNRLYLEQHQLWVQPLGRGYAWLDTGTHASLLSASEFVRTLEERQGLKLGCPEEVAFAQGWLSEAQLLALAEPLASSGYGDYLKQLLQHQKDVFLGRANRPLSRL